MDNMQSGSIQKLCEALVKVQGTLEAVPKSAENPFFKSKYADLASIWDAVREPLFKNGLAVVQQPGANGDNITLTTTLMHVSGEWIKSTAEAKPVKDDPQGVGSCITYLRRYSLSSMIGVSTEDDDGNEASRPTIAPNVKQRPMQKEMANRAAARAETKEQDNHVKDIANEAKKETEEARLTVLNLLIGKGKPFASDIKKAKAWMEEQAKKGFDDITIENCRTMYKAAQGLKA